jgi:hemerythrin-like domain-containing protein
MPTEVKAYLRTLHRDHHSFRNLLDTLEQQSSMIGGDQFPDFRLMHDVVDFLEHYPRYEHDALEDAALRSVTTDAGDRCAQAERLHALRAAVARRATRLAREIDAIGIDTVVPVDRLAHTTLRYVSAFRRYMLLEERCLSPLATSLQGLHNAPYADEAVDPAAGGAVSMLATGYRALGQDIANRLGCDCRLQAPVSSAPGISPATARPPA